MRGERSHLPRQRPRSSWEAIGRDDSRAAFARRPTSPARPIGLGKSSGGIVKPAPAAPTDAVLDRIFSDLGSEDFATREKASKQLEEYGEQVVASVRKRLAGDLTAEARQRAAAFLKTFVKPTLTPRASGNSGPWNCWRGWARPRRGSSWPN